MRAILISALRTFTLYIHKGGLEMNKEFYRILTLIGAIYVAMVVVYVATFVATEEAQTVAVATWAVAVATWAVAIGAAVGAVIGVAAVGAVIAALGAVIAALGAAGVALGAAGVAAVATGATFAAVAAGVAAIFLKECGGSPDIHLGWYILHSFVGTAGIGLAVYFSVSLYGVISFAVALSAPIVFYFFSRAYTDREQTEV